MSAPEDRCPTCGVALSEPVRSGNCPIPEEHTPRAVPARFEDIEEAEQFAIDALMVIRQLLDALDGSTPIDAARSNASFLLGKWGQP